LRYCEIRRSDERWESTDDVALNSTSPPQTASKELQNSINDFWSYHENPDNPEILSKKPWTGLHDLQNLQD